jgi:hypothetical protein
MDEGAEGLRPTGTSSLIGFGTIPLLGQVDEN